MVKSDVREEYRYNRISFYFVSVEVIVSDYGVIKLDIIPFSSLALRCTDQITQMSQLATDTNRYFLDSALLLKQENL